LYYQGGKRIFGSRTNTFLIMDIESLGTNIEIVHKVIEQWRRTGRLSGVERAFLLDKLKEIQSAVEAAGELRGNAAIAAGERAMDRAAEERGEAGPAAECEQHEVAGPASGIRETLSCDEEPSVSFTVEASETITEIIPEYDILEQEIVMEIEITDVAGLIGGGAAAESAEALRKEPESVEAPREEQPAADTRRRGKLGRKAIRSLYCDSPEEDNAAGNAATDAVALTESDTEEPVKESPVESSEQAPQDAVLHKTNLAAHKKAVLGEVINQGSRTVGETIAPQAKKKIDAEKVSDLKKAIGVNDRYLIIRDLFGGDADAFDEAVARFNDFDDLNDAMLFIHDSYRWDHNSDGAKLMIDIIVRKLM
jgi:hypothetical protein